MKKSNIYVGQSRSKGIKGKWIGLLRKPSGTAVAIIKPQPTKKKALSKIKKVKGFGRKNILKLR